MTGYVKSFNQTERIRFEIFFLNLIIVCYLFRTIIPILKFPFLILSLLFIFYASIKYSKLIVHSFLPFIHAYLLPIILASILILALLFSKKIYLVAFKDCINAIILIFVFYLLNIVIAHKNSFNFLLSRLLNYIIFFALIISVVGFLDMLDIYSPGILQNFTELNETTSAEISIDSNFALLPVFFGIIGLFYLLRKSQSTINITWYTFYLTIFSLCIIFSGSRRGIIVFIVFFIFLFVAILWSELKKKKTLKIFISNIIPFIFSLTFTVILLSLFFLQTTFSFKVKTIDFLGSKNFDNARSNISQKLFRYYSIKDKNISFNDFDEKLWTWGSGFDMKDPDSGWGSRKHKTIFPLSGKNVAIVPDGVKGYMLDSTCNVTYSQDDDVCEAYTLIASLNVEKGEHISASTFCFVSDSFDVDIVSITVGYSSINSNIVSGKVTSLYDLKFKGVWQKMEIDFDCNDGKVPIYLSVRKKGVTNFRTQCGYVIFANPIYNKSSTQLNGLPEIIPDMDEDNIQSFNQYGVIEVSNNYTEKSMIVKNYLTEFSFIKAYPNELYISSFLTFPGTLKYQKKTDPIRDFVSRLIKEDTSYCRYKEVLTVDTKWGKKGEGRIERWLFGFQIFTREYSLRQNLVGGGFAHLNWFGYYFLNDKTKSDWPHNPFLSILLYSGILGLLVYCFFLYKVFYYYIKYIKEYPLLFIFFLITFFFSFFSGGSPFDPPIMGFFSILPFFIHSVHKRDESQKQPDNLD